MNVLHQSQQCLLILALYFTLSCNHQVPPNNDTFDLTIKSHRSTVELTFVEQFPVVNIYSQTGIGSVDLISQAGSWPDSLEVRLHVTGLEQLQLQAGERTVTAFVNSSGEHRFKSRLTGGADDLSEVQKSQVLNQITLSTADQNGPQDLIIPLKKGWFRILIANAFMPDNSDTLTIKWVDFYR